MIVADASWIIALQDPEDAHHADATRINDEIGAELVLLHQLTMAECLVGAAKLGQLGEAARRLTAACDVISADPGAPIRWAALRATTPLRLPDVIVLDTALHHGAAAVATFDDRLSKEVTNRNLRVYG